jgi:BirA family biotin operon repressor/biotin-[acetyl-CoA-carboxylase] ligase
MSWDQKLFHWHLKTRRFGREIVYLEEVDSTNRWLSDNHKQFNFSGGVVVAGHQTAGRGRHDRTWWDYSGRSLLFSIVMRHRSPEREVAFLNLNPAIALGENLRDRFSGVQASLKWPNDVLLNGRKIAGVLGQTMPSGAVQVAIIGMGINVLGAREDLPEEIRERSSTIEAETGALIAPEILLAETLNGWEPLHDDWMAGNLEQLRGRWLELGPTVGSLMNRRTAGEMVSGTFAGIGDRGQLLLRRPNGDIEEVVSGDIEP